MARRQEEKEKNGEKKRQGIQSRGDAGISISDRSFTITQKQSKSHRKDNSDDRHG